MRRLTKYLRPYRLQCILGPAAKLIEAVFELIVPLVMARIIDVGIAAGDRGYVVRMSLVLVLLGFTGLCCALFCQYSAARASQGFGTTLRRELYHHINTLSHAEIDRIGSSSMVNRIVNDVNQLQTAVAMLIRLVIRAPFLVIGATVMAVGIDLKLSLIFLAAAPIIAFILYFIMSRCVPYYRTIQKKLDRISLVTSENLQGVRVIRAFSRQEAECRRFDAANEDHREVSMRVGRVNALLNPLTFVVVNLAIVAIIWAGGLRVQSGALTQGQIVALVNYMNQILLALVVVANLVVIFTRAAASAARVNEVLELAPSVTDRAGAAPAAGAAGTPRVEFDGVDFAYSSGENALSGVSFTAAPGETVGVIGGTGSGKSTLVSLIPRFYDVKSGSVRVNGVDVRDWPSAALRAQVGVVPQQAVLFSGTLRDNLKWGAPQADDAALWAALETAQAADFVKKLPGGLDASILQGGQNLSGGQRQRLTIARALAGRPDILILDDSASALDFATDAALRRALRRDVRGATVFLVSQRVNTVRGADKIVVLDDGAVAGVGTHEELFRSCEAYREICLSQLTGEEAERA
ncbi:ABC transporter ATP-binding protein [Anaerofilum sp. BX8]|uniref:ABC transporter ATP-binding protein n=1 Tax=Anaerofilum hominis TaxID=2763016 RepID=A0A923I7D9_9FIRM|nr:ABC transporter ATP-binding protein [Anaerofilum hominis]MBC5581650.1 ABC transporter ATP-binding protein [Anaerofilum hominis]